VFAVHCLCALQSFLGIGTQQVKWAKEMLQNIRQCCCVAGADVTLCRGTSSSF
jgi:hypothetical protein